MTYDNRTPGLFRPGPDNIRPTRSALEEAALAARSNTPRGTMESSILLGTELADGPEPSARPSSGVFVEFTGASHGYQPFYMTASDLACGGLFLGAASCGKTNTIDFAVDALLRQMTERDVMLILDTKGDFYDTFFQPGYDEMIGCSKRFRAQSAKWNIFCEIDDIAQLSSAGIDHTIHEHMAREMMRQLFDSHKSTSQPFFTEAAADLAAAVMIDLMRCTQKGEKDLLCNKKLVSCLHDLNGTTLGALCDRNPDMAYLRNYIGEKSTSNQAMGVLGELNCVCSQVFFDVFATGGPTDRFSIRNAVRHRGGKVIFIEYDLAMANTLNAVYKLLISSALMEALSSSGVQGGNIYLILDELKLLPKMDNIADTLNFGRSLGVKVLAGVQNVNQLYDIYGREGAMAILSGFQTCMAFYSPDPETRRYVIERYGANYSALNYRALATQDRLPIQRDSHVVEDWVLRQLTQGQAVIDMPGRTPFRYHFDRFQSK